MPHGSERNPSPTPVAHRGVGWYGPGALLLITALLIMVFGPQMAQRIEYAATEARTQRIHYELSQNQALTELSSSFRKVAQVIEPSVVHIRVFRSRPMPDILGRSEGGEDIDVYGMPREYGVGSGWVYAYRGESSEGSRYIVTNHHVVRDADRIEVRFHDRSERRAYLVASDPPTDIAVLRVSGPLIAARVAEEPVEQGDIVFAFGSPFRFEFSMSQGIVSAKGRSIGILGRGGYENFIQTDAAINLGNSGGPLTNAVGEVVGMNTAIATRDGGYNGLGFAIPVQMVRRVADELIAAGNVARGQLGVYIGPLDRRQAATFGYDREAVLVEQPIPGSPADKAGIKRGDIITHLNNIPVTSDQQLRSEIAHLPPGTRVALTIFRNGDTLTVDVVLGELAEPPSQATRPPGPQPDPRSSAPLQGESMLQFLGIETLADLDTAAASQLGLNRPAVQVQSVTLNSIAWRAGLRPGQIILQVQGRAAENTRELVYLLEQNIPNHAVRLTVRHRGDDMFIFLVWPER